MVFEILFPVLIYVFLAEIRQEIPVQKIPVHFDLAKFLTATVTPFPTPEKMGIPGWKNETQKVFNSTLLMKDQQLLYSSVLDFKQHEEWLRFHSLED